MTSEELSYYRRWLHDESSTAVDTQIDFAPQTTYPLCEYLCYIRDWLWQPCCPPRTYDFTVHVVDSEGFYTEIQCSIFMNCL